MKMLCKFVPGGELVFDKHPVYLERFDPTTDEIALTTDIRKAQRFADLAELLAFWGQQSKIHPIRLDGKPSKPLTVFTITHHPADLRGLVNL